MIDKIGLCGIPPYLSPPSTVAALPEAAQKTASKVDKAVRELDLFGWARALLGALCAAWCWLVCLVRPSVEMDDTAGMSTVKEATSADPKEVLRLLGKNNKIIPVKSIEYKQRQFHHVYEDMYQDNEYEFDLQIDGVKIPSWEAFKERVETWRMHGDDPKSNSFRTLEHYLTSPFDVLIGDHIEKIHNAGIDATTISMIGRDKKITVTCGENIRFQAEAIVDVRKISTEPAVFNEETLQFESVPGERVGTYKVEVELVIGKDKVDLKRATLDESTRPEGI